MRRCHGLHRRLAGCVAGVPGGGGARYVHGAGAVLLPRAISAVRRTHPAVTVTTREGSTPALVRALRAGTIDLAVIASVPPFRPPDAESPALKLETLAERSLRLAVPTGHPLAAYDSVDVADLHGQRWIAGPVRDWFAKLQLVAAGAGITTISASMAPAVPPGVRVITVRGGPQELRRTILARMPGRMTEPVGLLAAALRAAAVEVGPAG
jgi:DNA-binding transcriptional LysR family regulator